MIWVIAIGVLAAIAGVVVLWNSIVVVKVEMQVQADDEKKDGAS